MLEMNIYSIGKIENKEDFVCIKLDSKFKNGLKGLKDFSHVQVLWWADKADRNAILEDRPYKNGPIELGVFSLRSPERPNPIMVSNVDIAYVDEEKGIVGLYYIDAFDGTPVIDLKPYTPSIDRIENPRVPDWQKHWPKSYEESESFDWEKEFNF